MNLQILTLVGLLAIPVVMPVLAQHAKQLTRWRPRSRKGSPWPVLVDLGCILWIAVLRLEGLLSHEVDAPEGVTLGWGSVLLLGLVAGAICTIGYDQFMARRRPPGAASPA
jgi:hypothetical protein